MKKYLCLILCALLLLLSVPTALGMGTVATVQLVHIETGNLDAQIITKYGGLESAVADAVSGDVIEVLSPVTVSAPLTIPANTAVTIVSGTERQSDANFGASTFVDTDPNAVKRTVTKNFSGSLFTLGEGSSVTFENITLDGGGKGGSKGGLLYVKSGAALTLQRSVTLQNAKLGTDSFGGAIYAEQGGTVEVKSAAFSGNTAARGGDIYAQQKADVSMKSGITADLAVKPGGADLTLLARRVAGIDSKTALPQEKNDTAADLTLLARELLG